MRTRRAAAVVRNILIEDRTVSRAQYAFFVHGLPGAPVRDLVVRDSAFGGVSRGSLLEHVEELSLRNVVIEPSNPPSNQEATRCP